MAIYLVNHRQEIVRPLAPAPMDLVHADGMNGFQFAVRQAPLHKPLHRAIDTFPTGLEGSCRLAPRQPARPAGKKAHHGQTHRSLAIAPRNVLHDHAVGGALHPPGGKDKEGLDVPQQHKEPRALRQPVIPRSRLEATGTLGGDASVRIQRDFDAAGPPVPVALEPDVLKNKSRKMLNGVQNGLNLQLHRWSLGCWFAFLFNSQTNRTRKDQRLLSLALPPAPMQFFTSNSLAAHLGGGRGCQGGVPVTGETLTASPGAIPSPPRNCL